MSQTERLKLPYILPGQAQKELFHNEALQALDIVVQPVVQSGQLDEPPASPVAGQAYLVGTDPVGDWSGHADALAAWTLSGWRFVEAFEGMEIASRNGLKLRFVDGHWEEGKLHASSVFVAGQKVLGERVAAIGEPAGGAVIDQQARATISHLLEALRLHGLIAPSV